MVIRIIGRLYVGLGAEGGFELKEVGGDIRIGGQDTEEKKLNFLQLTCVSVGYISFFYFLLGLFD